ncbi:hypothetical protein BC941DRAFT_430208 [Chlamydoabsidia padenii]|nr:hypothetical protein BC941DRAFT_430208 [Chlamydoabsidia padenii]
MYSTFQLDSKQHYHNDTLSVPLQNSNPADGFHPAQCTYPESSSLFYDTVLLNPTMAQPLDFYQGYDLFAPNNHFDTLLTSTPSPLLSSSSSSSCSPLLDLLDAFDPLSFLPPPSPKIESPKPKPGHFKCPFKGCHMVFGRKYNLNSHQVTHNGERVYACDCCAKKFVRRHDLKRHVRIHTGETPHKCLYCDRGYGRADALQRHYAVNQDCATKLLNDPSNPLHLRSKRKTRLTGFGAK